MKTYRITVNGVAYDVTVEETNGAAAPAPAAAPAAAPVAAPAPAAAPTSVPAGAVTVKAPMQGKIMKVLAAKGAAVKKGDVLFVLEAMKMENEIFAPQDGTVADVIVSAGADVATDAVLCTLN